MLKIVVKRCRIIYMELGNINGKDEVLLKLYCIARDHFIGYFGPLHGCERKRSNYVFRQLCYSDKYCQTIVLWLGR